MMKALTRLTPSPLLLTGLSIVLFVAAACAPILPPAAAPAADMAAPAAAPDGTITNILWQWASLTVRPTNETTAIANPENYTLILRDDGTLSGKADCNNFTGTYTQENGLVITLGATTLAACSEGSLGQQYLDLLGAVVAGGPDGQGNLALENAGGEKRMLFANGGAAPAL